jgi:integrase
MDIRNITDAIIFEHFKKVAIKKEIPYKAVKEAFGYVKGVFRKSIIDKIIKPEDDPCVYVDIQLLKKHCISKVKTAKERTLSDYERAVLLDKIHHPRSNNANPIVNFAVELSLYTGMSVGELSALRWCNIDEENNCIIIKEAEVYDPENKEYSISLTKNDKIRFFPITEKIKEIFSKIKAYEIKNGFYGEYVFQDSKGRIHARRISESVRNKTMSSEFVNTKSVHAIRRTLNSNLRCNGVSATVASSLLGHTQKVNEMNYTYDVFEMKEKAELIKKAGFIN